MMGGPWMGMKSLLGMASCYMDSLLMYPTRKRGVNTLDCFQLHNILFVRCSIVAWLISYGQINLAEFSV